VVTPAPFTSGDFLQMVESKRDVAAAMVESRLHCFEAWHASGQAVEFALKALIIRRERLNGWPSKESRPELYTHDLRRLFTLAGVDLKTAPAPLRASLKMVLDWDRAHEYSAHRTSRAEARSMNKAAFGKGGVVEWLNSQ
jgi:HEPN domain-containing protein